VFSLLISLILPEIAYRIYLSVNDPLAPETWSWWLTSAPDGEFDAELGQKLTPDSAIHASIVRNGLVVACLGEVYRNNSDGLAGGTTLADYAAADLKVVLTGDSFARWRLGGFTIADVLQPRLGAATNRSVAVLNLARGGYGMLQMISMAAAQAEQTRPQLIVVAFITDDLTRGRWWSKTAVNDGRVRELLAARPEDLDNPDRTSDTSVIDARATAAWCQERSRRGEDDPVVAEGSAFVKAEIARKNLRVNLFALNHAYFYAMLWRRLTGAPAPSGFPRISAETFAADARYRSGRENLRRQGVPIHFVHLPVQNELEAGRPLLAGAAANIWSAIERDFEARIVTYFDLKQRPAVPAVYNLEPLDGHPNASGIEFYGEILFSVIAERHLIAGLKGKD
jgi:hypothetical protein